MGILNVTPDSFADGGLFLDPAAAEAAAVEMEARGADIIDVGGESTRPGSDTISAEEEIARVQPVLHRLSRSVRIPISIDTSKPEVAHVAIAEGASMINDIQALTAPYALEAVAPTGCAVCIMHMKGEPATMQREPRYDDVLGEVKAFLKESVRKAMFAGIGRDRIVVDPGFGFGKTPKHNLELLRNLSSFADLGVPLLAGLSRKSTIGHITGRPIGERLAGSLAMALLALERGAKILRVHDVKETRDVIAVWQAYKHDA